MKNVTKKGQWFSCPEILYGKMMTVESFYGESGIEYDTAKEAKSNNKGLICVKNKVYGGTVVLEYTVLDVEMSKANGTL